MSEPLSLSSEYALGPIGPPSFKFCMQQPDGGMRDVLVLHHDGHVTTDGLTPADEAAKAVLDAIEMQWSGRCAAERAAWARLVKAMRLVERNDEFVLDARERDAAKQALRDLGVDVDGLLNA